MGEKENATEEIIITKIKNQKEQKTILFHYAHYSRTNPDEDFAQCFYGLLCDAENFRRSAPEKFVLFGKAFPKYIDAWNRSQK